MNKEEWSTVSSIIRKIRVAVLVTRSAGDELHARPMMARAREFDGGVWFLARRDGGLLDDVVVDARVLATFAGQNEWLVLGGTARPVEDRATIREMWEKSDDEWLPKGADDPDIVLLRVDAERADYWKSPLGPAKLFPLAQPARGTVVP